MPEGDDPRDEDDGDDPRDVPLIVKATGAAQTGSQVRQAVPGKPQTDASLDPLSCTTGADGSCMVALKPAEFKHVSMFRSITGGMELEVAADKAKSYNILVPTVYQLAAPWPNASSAGCPRPRPRTGSPSWPRTKGTSASSMAG